MAFKASSSPSRPPGARPRRRSNPVSAISVRLANTVGVGDPQVIGLHRQLQTFLALQGRGRGELEVSDVSVDPDRPHMDAFFGGR